MKAAHEPLRGSRAVLVTDARDGLGRATALLLADRGACVLACAPALTRMDDLPRETARGGMIEIHRLDPSDPASCDEALARVRSLYGRVDALVHTRIATHFGAVEEAQQGDVERIFSANLFGPLTLIRRVLPEMRERRSGMIVCVSSAAGRVALPMSALLSSSHHALEGLCDALRLELNTFGIHVVLVEPGLVRRGVVAATSDRIEQALRSVDEASPYANVARTLGDVLRAHEQTAATPRDVAEVIAKALESATPRPRYPVTRRTAAWLWARKVLPDRVLDRRLARAMGLKAPRTKKR